MSISKIKSIAVVATVGTIAMLCVPTAQAAMCVFACGVATSVPEPATLGLLALGVAGAAIARRRK
jgi:hypothetical protein